MPRVSRLDEVGAIDDWRCWLCDEPVDSAMSVNDPRGPSIDSCITKAKARNKARAGAPAQERLAHRGCNTGRGATDPVVEGGTHATNLTHPSEVNAAIKQFLRDLPA